MPRVEGHAQAQPTLVPEPGSPRALLGQRPLHEDPVKQPGKAGERDPNPCLRGSQASGSSNDVPVSNASPVTETPEGRQPLASDKTISSDRAHRHSGPTASPRPQVGAEAQAPRPRCCSVHQSSLPTPLTIHAHGSTFLTHGTQKQAASRRLHGQENEGRRNYQLLRPFRARATLKPCWGRTEAAFHAPGREQSLPRDNTLRAAPNPLPSGSPPAQADGAPLTSGHVLSSPTGCSDFLKVWPFKVQLGRQLLGTRAPARPHQARVPGHQPLTISRSRHILSRPLAGGSFSLESDFLPVQPRKSTQQRRPG